MRTFTNGLILALFFLMMLFAVVYNQERMECDRWGAEQKEHGFSEWQDWQVEQCANYNIKLVKQ